MARFSAARTSRSEVSSRGAATNSLCLPTNWAAGGTTAIHSNCSNVSPDIIEWNTTVADYIGQLGDQVGNFSRNHLKCTETIRLNRLIDSNYG